MSEGTEEGLVPRFDQRRIVIAALLAFAMLRLIALTRYPFWTDETWTIEVGSFDFRRLLRSHADDQTHPPGFYIALWFWRLFVGDSLPAVRLLPCLAGIATAIPMVMIARSARMTNRATILAVLLGAGSGLLVTYSAELRNYSLLAFMASASLAIWLRTRDDEKAPVLPLTVVNVLLVYTHYFGLFVLFVEWLDALFWARKRLRAATISSAIAIGLLLPWVGYTIHRAGITGRNLEVVNWLQIPNHGDLIDVVRDTIGGSPWLALDLVIAVAAMAALTVWMTRERRSAAAPANRLLLLAVLIPVAIAFLASVFGPKPMWLTRYLISVSPPMLVLVAGAIDGVMPRRLTSVAVALALVPATLTAWSLARGTVRPRFDLVLREIASRETAAEADVYAPSAVESRPLAYALAREPNLPRPVRVRPISPLSRRNVEQGWLVWSEVNPPAGPPPTADLIRGGYTLLTTLGFKSDEDSLVAVRFARRGAP